MKYENVCLRQSMMKLHMRRANYVGTIFNTDEPRLTAQTWLGWESCNCVECIAFPEDISDMFFVVDKRNDYENDDESSGDESPEEYLPDSSDSEESYVKYY